MKDKLLPEDTSVDPDPSVEGAFRTLEMLRLGEDKTVEDISSSETIDAGNLVRVSPVQSVMDEIASQQGSSKIDTLMMVDSQQILQHMEQKLLPEIDQFIKKLLGGTVRSRKISDDPILLTTERPFEITFIGLPCKMDIMFSAGKEQMVTLRFPEEGIPSIQQGSRAIHLIVLYFNEDNFRFSFFGDAVLDPQILRIHQRCGTQFKPVIDLTDTRDVHLAWVVAKILRDALKKLQES